MGGKCVVFGGDFRQILPVRQGGDRDFILDAAINSSNLWQHCRIFTLTKNMRLRQTDSIEQQLYKKVFRMAFKLGGREIGNIP